MNEFKAGDKVRYVYTRFKKIVNAVGEISRTYKCSCDVDFGADKGTYNLLLQDLEPVFEHGEEVEVSNNTCVYHAAIYAAYVDGRHYCYGETDNDIDNYFLDRWKNIRRPQKTKTIEVPVDTQELAKQVLSELPKFSYTVDEFWGKIERLCKAIGGCDE